MYQTMNRALACALLLMYTSSGSAATDSKATAKAPTKAPAKAPAKPKAQAPTEASATLKPLKGKTETLACRLGTEDRHARIAVVLIGGTTDSFAYYSKWKPRTCSIYLQRGRDMFSKWAETGTVTTVNLERGAFLIEHRKGEYHFIFRDIDRERYCGMEGVISGSLTIKKGRDQCELNGDIMVEGTPLGQAFVNREEDKPPPGLMPPSVPAASDPTATSPVAPAATSDRKFTASPSEASAQ